MNGSEKNGNSPQILLNKNRARLATLTAKIITSLLNSVFKREIRNRLSKIIVRSKAIKLLTPSKTNLAK